LRMSVMTSGAWELGCANLKDFQVFRRTQEKRKDFILNPHWLNQVMVLQPLKEVLQDLRTTGFEERKASDKQLIGSSYGRLVHLFNEINA